MSNRFLIFLFLIFSLMPCQLKAEDQPSFNWDKAISIIVYKPSLHAFSNPVATKYEKAHLEEMLEGTVRLRQKALRLLTPSMESQVSGMCVSQPIVPAVILRMNPENSRILGTNFQKDWMLIDLLDKNLPAANILKRGDHITKLNGVAIEKLSTAGFLKSTVPEKVTFEVLRQNNTFEIELPLISQSCDVIFFVRNDSYPTAYASGKMIVFTTAMMKFFDNDDQFAFVLGHEISHVYLNHIKTLKNRNAVSNLFGVALATGTILESRNGLSLETLDAFSAGKTVGRIIGAPFSKDEERNADKMSLLFMEKSGYDPVQGVSYFRKAAMEKPNTNSYNFTHPASWERYADLMKHLGHPINLENEKNSAEMEWEKQGREKLRLKVAQEIAAEKLINVDPSAGKKGSRAENYPLLMTLLGKKDVKVDKDWNILNDDEFSALEARSKLWKKIKRRTAMNKVEEKLGKPDQITVTFNKFTQWNYADGHIVFNEQNKVSLIDKPMPPWKFRKGSQVVPPQLQVPYNNSKSANRTVPSTQEAV